MRWGAGRPALHLFWCSMNVLPEVLIDQIVAYSASNTNTVTITINARADHYVVIDQVIFSADTTPQSNASHVVITNTANNSVVTKWDLQDSGAQQVTFKDGLVASSLGGGASAVMVAAQPSSDNHVTVLYR